MEIGKRKMQNEENNFTFYIFRFPLNKLCEY